MSRLTDLLHAAERHDPQLAADLAKEIKILSARREFGLNFERHLPEAVDLPGRPVRRGDKVRFLPDRETGKGSDDQRLWRVAAVTSGDEGRVASLTRTGADLVEETKQRSCDDLVVVAEFRDPVYPGLVSTGRVERDGEKPFHAVINAENFPALQALLYTHEGKVCRGRRETHATAAVSSVWLCRQVGLRRASVLGCRGRRGLVPRPLVPAGGCSRRGRRQRWRYRRPR